MIVNKADQRTVCSRPMVLIKMKTEISIVTAPSIPLLGSCVKKGDGEMHGMTDTKTYRTWADMLSRCRNPKHRKYHRYGGRGISVCEKWYTFSNFYRDVGLRPDGTTIDRFPNPDGNYEPGNVRWAHHKDQQRNKSSNIWITLSGERRVLSEWLELFGMSRGTYTYRVSVMGWNPIKALTSPIRCY